MRSSSSMDRRRQQKFQEHKVEVKAEKVEGFSHAVYARGKLVGRTNGNRWALKLAHQFVRNTK